MAAETLLTDQFLSRISSLPLFQKAVVAYGATKHSCGLMEQTLGAVEYQVQNIGQRLYKNYCQPPLETALKTTERAYDGLMYAVSAAKSIIIKAASLEIGLALVFAQLSVAVCVSGVNRFLNFIIVSKQIGNRALTSAKKIEQSLQERLIQFVHAVNDMSQVPIVFLDTQAHSFLDVASAVVDRTLGIESECDPPESTLCDRAVRLSRRLSNVLTSRAHEDIIDPMYERMQDGIELLSKLLALLDIVRERQAWVVEKMDQLNTSLWDLKCRFDDQAAQLKENPEELLMKSIRNSSSQLSRQVSELKATSHLIIGEAAASKMDAILNYLNQLDENFKSAENVYQLRDEVLSEARTKLADLAQCISEYIMSNKIGS